MKPTRGAADCAPREELDMDASRSTPAAAALALFAVFTVWVTWQAKTIETRFAPDAQTATLRGKPAPAFSLVALDGRTVSAADFRGKARLVVSFWASWCGPCHVELPALARFYQRTHKSAADYEIVTINIDDQREAAETAATQLKLPFGVLLDPSGTVMRTYGVNAIPALVIIDKDGTVIRSITGLDPGFEFILAQDLGIKNYNPFDGASDGSAGH
jgi:peroxiredoxin